ncbi:hypothetical protein COOONC_23994 [Cooperia oncophora]
MVKYNYLLSALKGQAKESINKFQLTKDNYDKVVQFLLKKNNRDLVVNQLVQKTSPLCHTKLTNKETNTERESFIFLSILCREALSADTLEKGMEATLKEINAHVKMADTLDSRLSHHVLTTERARNSQKENWQCRRHVSGKPPRARKKSF